MEQPCAKEGKYLISQAKTREHLWPRRRCSVISGAQHWVYQMPARSRRGTHPTWEDPEVPQSSPGLSRAGEAQQPQTREPSLLPQATQTTTGPDQMSEDPADTPKRSCTHQEEQLQGLETSLPRQVPPFLDPFSKCFQLHRLDIPQPAPGMAVREQARFEASSLGPPWGCPEQSVAPGPAGLAPVLPTDPPQGPLLLGPI